MACTTAEECAQTVCTWHPSIDGKSSEREKISSELTILWLQIWVCSIYESLVGNLASDTFHVSSKDDGASNINLRELPIFLGVLAVLVDTVFTRTTPNSATYVAVSTNANVLLIIKLLSEIYIHVDSSPLLYSHVSSPGSTKPATIDVADVVSAAAAHPPTRAGSGDKAAISGLSLRPLAFFCLLEGPSVLFVATPDKATSKKKAFSTSTGRGM